MDASSNSKKFMFDLHNFDPIETVEEVVEEVAEEVEPPPPTFSTEELEAAKEMAFEHGRQKGLEESQELREERTAETLQKIAELLTNMNAEESYRERQYERESVKLGIEIIDTLIPTLHEKIGADALQKVLPDTLRSQSGQSEILIKLHPDSTVEVDSMIDSLWDDPENAPKCKVVADSSIEIGGCDITWSDGGMVRTPSDMVKKLRETLEELLEQDEKTDNNPS